MKNAILCILALILGNVICHYAFDYTWNKVAEISGHQFVAIFVYYLFWGNDK